MSIMLWCAAMVVLWLGMRDMHGKQLQLGDIVLVAPGQLMKVIRFEGKRAVVEWGGKYISVLTELLIRSN